MTANEKSTIPVCCVCGTPADSKQRLAIGMLKKVGTNPRAYCLRCWAKRFPEIAARQEEEKEKINRRKAKQKRGSDESISV